LIVITRAAIGQGLGAMQPRLAAFVRTLRADRPVDDDASTPR
jgi:hypothetical protein